MPLGFPAILRVVAGSASIAFAAFALCAEPPAQPAGESAAETAAKPDLARARDRAELMHKLYSATLDAMHDHYFHANRAVLPARAMEDVFAALNEESQIESRWISVNTPAMSLHHEPRDAFEKKAAAAIAAGKESFEAVENGRYRRVGAIPLADGCVSCHTGFSVKPASTPRFAGLVISMPVETK